MVNDRHLNKARSGPVPANSMPKTVRNYLICLITTTLISFGTNIKAQQPTNEEAYNQLTIQFVKNNPTPVSSAEGLITEGLKPFIILDSLSPKTLSLTTTGVSLKKISAKTALRSLAVVAEIRDSASGIISELKFSDTISFKELKKIQKTEQVLLRADNPRIMGKIFLPAILVLAGIAGIITLFYLRS